MKAKLIAIVVLVVGLVACGGGGGGGSDAVAVETAVDGFWSGTTSTDRAVFGVVLDDGTYYFIYTAVGAPTFLDGFVQGTGTANNGTFTSTNARDFNFSGSKVDGTISGSYFTKQSLSGSISSGSTITFQTTYDSDYENVPTLAAIAGDYTGVSISSVADDNANIQINASGSFTGVGMSGCAFSGTVTPRVKGNLYNVVVTFGGAPCLSPGLTLRGIAYYDSGVRQLFAATVLDDRSDFVFYLGDKV